MYCRKCGKENPDGAKFCRVCGSPLLPKNHENAEEQKTLPAEKKGRSLIYAIVAGVVLLAVVSAVVMLGRGNGKKTAAEVTKESSEKADESGLLNESDASAESQTAEVLSTEEAVNAAGTAESTQVLPGAEVDYTDYLGTYAGDYYAGVYMSRVITVSNYTGSHVEGSFYADRRNSAASEILSKEQYDFSSDVSSDEVFEIQGEKYCFAAVNGMRYIMTESSREGFLSGKDADYFVCVKTDHAVVPSPEGSMAGMSQEEKILHIREVYNAIEQNGGGLRQEGNLYYNSAGVLVKAVVSDENTKLSEVMKKNGYKTFKLQYYFDGTSGSPLPVFVFAVIDGKEYRYYFSGEDFIRRIGPEGSANDSPQKNSFIETILEVGAEMSRT